MTIQITGKNVDAGDAFKTYITDKIETSLSKYIGPDVSGHIRLEKGRNGFKTDCSIKIPSGLVLEASGEGGDAYASADSAIERLETRVRRHKRRLKSHHGLVRAPDNETAVSDYTLRIDDEGVDEANGAQHPVIIAETERGLRELPVSEAVMQLDLTESAFLVFRNAGHGGLNVVYRRPDGHIGWIDAKPGVGA